MPMTTLVRRVATPLTLLALAMPAFTQDTPTPAPKPCAGPEHRPARRVRLTGDALRDALGSLSTAPSEGSHIDAVAVGSPHFSTDEFAELLRLLRGRRMGVPFYACTGRHVLATLEERGQVATLTEAGVRIVVDTCVVVTPILPGDGGVLMTSSGKFAHYGPSNVGYDVVYGSLEDCVESAVLGRVARDEQVWAW